MKTINKLYGEMILKAFKSFNAAPEKYDEHIGSVKECLIRLSNHEPVQCKNILIGRPQQTKEFEHCKGLFAVKKGRRIIDDLSRYDVLYLIWAVCLKIKNPKPYDFPGWANRWTYLYM